MVTPPLGGRVAEVRARVAAASGGRDVTVVAVTKGFGPATAQAALDAGLGDLGENYAAELVAKAAAVGPARWHHLGAVQRRQVRRLAPLVHLWHGVDRAAAGAEIAARAPGARVLVQVSLGGVDGRPGCTWEAAPALVGRLRDLGLRVEGLMGVAGGGPPRAQFRRLAALARSLGLDELSMGMSGDLEVALEEGATIVRVGRALFGPRPDGAALRRYGSVQGGW